VDVLVDTLTLDGMSGLNTCTGLSNQHFLYNLTNLAKANTNANDQDHTLAQAQSCSVAEANTQDQA
jgi:hypothetical protein